MNSLNLDMNQNLIAPGAMTEVANVQAQMVIARTFPREITKSVDAILAECKRPEVAEVAAYEYPRGGELVYGASIRLAEVIAQNWGNFTYGLKEISSDDGVTKMLAFAWDIQSNVRKESSFAVRHGRYTKASGFKEFQSDGDPRDIYETTANFGARRMRSCIQAIIPAWVFDKALKTADETLRELISDVPKEIDNLLTSFVKFKVMRRHIEEFIKKPVKKAKVTDVLRLQRVFASINDHIAAPSHFFDVGVDADKAAGFGKFSNKSSKPEKKVSELSQKLKEKNAQDQNQDQNQDQEVEEEDFTPLLKFVTKMGEAQKKKFQIFWNDRHARTPDYPYWFSILNAIREREENK